MLRIHMDYSRTVPGAIKDKVYEVQPGAKVFSYYGDPHINYVEADGDALEAAFKIAGMPRLPVKVMKFPQPWANLIILNWDEYHQ